MIKRKLALGLATIAMGAYGCGPSGTEFPERDFVCEAGAAPPCETTAEASTPEMRTAEEPATTADMTYTYVVSVISLPESQDGLAAGFNLDDINSGNGTDDPNATCEEFVPDYESLLDPGHVGVDNALQGIIGVVEGFLDAGDCPGGVRDGCLDALLQEQVNEGSVILMMEVSGVNDFSYDSSVTLQLVMGGLAPGSGTACTTDAECTTAGERCIDDACANAPVLGGDGEIEPGQTFMRTMNLGDPVQGDIFGGRLRAQTELLTLMIDAGDFELPLEISQPEVRFDISADGLENGQIGGYVFNEAIIEAASVIAPGMEDTVRGLVEMIADVEPSSDPAVCSAISVGITFGATTAALE